MSICLHKGVPTPLRWHCLISHLKKKTCLLYLLDCDGMYVIKNFVISVSLTHVINLEVITHKTIKSNPFLCEIYLFAIFQILLNW